MRQNKDVKNWTDCWKDSKEKTARMSDLGSADLWNRRADGFAKNLSPQKKQKRTEAIFELLDLAGFQAKGARILDIGCGPGAIAIPLARLGARVTALDISYKALEYLKANAEREGLAIDTIECSWWKANIDELGFRKKFDLVVTSMTPSVKNTETFDRMMSCSREFCYYSHFLQFGRNRNHDEILHRIMKKDPEKRSGGISPFIYNFMYLYLNGYRPLVRIQHKKHRMETNWEEAAERSIRFYDCSGSGSATARRKIRQYYKASAVNGKYRTQSDGYTGMMAWNVNRRTLPGDEV